MDQLDHIERQYRKAFQKQVDDLLQESNNAFRKIKKKAYQPPKKKNKKRH